METTKDTGKKTIYDSSYSEVFFKHLLAGFGQGLGNMLVYLILIAILYNLFMIHVFPRMAPLLNTLTGISESLKNVSDLKTNSGIIIPGINLQNILGK